MSFQLGLAADQAPSAYGARPRWDPRLIRPAPSIPPIGPTPHRCWRSTGTASTACLPRSGPRRHIPGGRHQAGLLPCPSARWRLWCYPSRLERRVSGVNFVRLSPAWSAPPRPDLRQASCSRCGRGPRPMLTTSPLLPVLAPCLTAAFCRLAHRPAGSRGHRPVPVDEV